MSYYESMAVCAAAGDALGWPNERVSKSYNVQYPSTEFFDWERRVGGRYYSHLEGVDAGEFSDDTQLSLSVLRALSHKENWLDYLAFHELPFWLLYQRGGGTNCKTSAGYLEKFNKLAYEWPIACKEDFYVAGGNGAVMRIYPHIIAEPDNLTKLLVDSTLDGLLTHGSPVSILGTGLFVTVLYHVNKTHTFTIDNVNKGWEDFKTFFDRNSISSHEKLKPFFEDVPESAHFEQSWDDAFNFLKEGIELLNNLPTDENEVYGKFMTCTERKGAATVSTLSALYIALVSKDVEEAIRKGANLRDSDTDSLAGMAGALLGLTVDITSSLPAWILKVASCDYIRKLTLLPQPLPSLPPYCESTKKLKKIIDESSVEDTLTLPCFGRCKVIAKSNLAEDDVNYSVDVTQIATEDGTEIYVKAFHRN